MSDNLRYRQFWQDVGDDFPDLAGASSTVFYRRNEERLLTEHLPPLGGLRILKTDLWDEAKNTRILRWAADGGARVFGVDISPPIVGGARRAFDGVPFCATVGDVRALPYAGGAFDAVYSMGTVEHFHETEQALREIRRVLRPGGIAIIGVPNRHDPFLRPLLVALLSRVGMYGYGFEKSYSRRVFRQMLTAAGFEVTAETAILFMPGWLRMADLLGHTRWRPLTHLTRPAVALFSWVDRHFVSLRRHGYLLATVCRAPQS